MGVKSCVLLTYCPHNKKTYIRLVVHGLIFSGKVVINEDIGTKCERSDGDEYRVEVRMKKKLNLISSCIKTVGTNASTVVRASIANSIADSEHRDQDYTKLSLGVDRFVCYSYVL
ncbi:hypothetical protein Tco_0805068, partial [Tanacetum coccineum]